MKNLTKIFSVSILLTLILVLSAASPIHAAEVIKTIAIGGSPLNAPLDVAYDSGKGEIFVTDPESNTVSVISDSTNSLVETVSMGPNPMFAAYDSAKGEIFVANQINDTVSVISDSSGNSASLTPTTSI